MWQEKAFEKEKREMTCALQLVAAPLTNFRIMLAQMPDGLQKDMCEVVEKRAARMVEEGTQCLASGNELPFTKADAQGMANQMLRELRIDLLLVQLTCTPPSRIVYRHNIS